MLLQNILKFKGVSSLSKHATVYSVSKIIQFTIKFIIPIFLVRIFSTEYYGIYQQITTISLMLPAFLSLGISSSFYFFYPNLSKNDRESLLSQSFFTILFIAILFFITFNFFGQYFFYLFGNNGANLINYKFLVSLFVCFFIIGELIEHLLIVEQNTSYIFRYIIITSVLRSTLILLAAYYTNDVLYTFSAVAIFQLCLALYTFFYFQNKYKINLKKTNLKLYKAQLMYSLPIAGSTLIEMLTRQSSTLILLASISPPNFAIYTVGLFRIPFIDIIYQSVGQISIVKFSEYFFKNEREKAITLWHNITIKLFTLMFPIIVFFFTIAEPLFVFLFTEKFLHAAIVFRIIILSFLLLPIITVPILNANKKNNLFFKINLIYAPMSIVITYFFVKFFSYIGGAISILLCTTIINVVFIIAVKHLFHLTAKQLLPYKQLLKIFISAIIPIIPIFFICKLPFSNFKILSIATFFYFIPLIIVYKKSKILSFKKMNILFTGLK